MKQILFKDIEDTPHVLHAGIMLDNGDVVCGCCGGLFEASEKNTTWVLLKEYDDWMDIQMAICEDDDDIAKFVEDLEKENQ